jgi:hypothetical protein
MNSTKKIHDLLNQADLARVFDPLLSEWRREALFAASHDDLRDEPLVPSITTPHGIKMPASVSKSRLAKLSCWVAVDPGADTVLIRVYRYRRLTAAGPPSYSPVTTPFTLNSAVPGTFEFPLDDYILPGYDFAPNDQIAIRRDFTDNGGGLPHILIKWAFEPVEFED